MKSVAVFCGSSIGFNDIYKNEAIKLGKFLATNKITMVYGGGKIGMMGVIADTILEYNGEVIGVIPELLRHEEVEHSNVSAMLITKTMSERKIKISKLVHGYIALPGGFGTLDEIFEALTLNQLGIESKPVGILNTNGFFDSLINQVDIMVKEGYLKKNNRDLLLVESSIELLLDKMLSYNPPIKTPVTNKIVR